MNIHGCSCPPLLVGVGICRHPRLCWHCGALTTGERPIESRCCGGCAVRERQRIYADGASPWMPWQTLGEELRATVLRETTEAAINEIEFARARSA